MKRKSRGAAIVEAVVLLPTLVVLLLGARFVARRYEMELEAVRESRTCAVRFAYGGCKQVPVGCPEPAIGAPPSAGTDGGLAGISQGLASAEALVRKLSSVPVLGAAVDELLGKNARFEQGATFDPLIRHDRTLALVNGSVVFPCNEVPHTDDVAKQVFQLVTAPFF